MCENYRISSNEFLGVLSKGGGTLYGSLSVNGTLYQAGNNTKNHILYGQKTDAGKNFGIYQEAGTGTSVVIFSQEQNGDTTMLTITDSTQKHDNAYKAHIGTHSNGTPCFGEILTTQSCTWNNPRFNQVKTSYGGDFSLSNVEFPVEIGKILDFHGTNEYATAGEDYLWRVQVTNDYITFYNSQDGGATLTGFTRFTKDATVLSMSDRAWLVSGITGSVNFVAIDAIGTNNRRTRIANVYSTTGVNVLAQNFYETGSFSARFVLSNSVNQAPATESLRASKLLTTDTTPTTANTINWTYG